MAFEWTILVLAYFLVACRVYVRMFIRGVGLHAADYWLIVGLVSCQGLLICDTLTFRMHAMDDFVLANNSIPIKKIRFATNYFFDTGIYFPKFSIIAFYFNLVPITNPTMRRALFGLTGITVAFALITVFCDTFWCGPNPSVNWAEGEQTCTVFTSMTLMRLNWALNFITEVLSMFSNFPPPGSFFSNSLQLDLVFPIPLLQGLMTSTRKKIGLAVVFGMGIITIAVSIGRFVTMLYVHNDISIYIWATAEICISVMIVALTALRPLLRKMTNSVSTSSDDRSGALACENYDVTNFKSPTELFTYVTCQEELTSLMAIIMLCRNVDMHSLDVGISRKTSFSQFPTNTTLLYSAKGNSPVTVIARVDPDHTCLDPLGNLMRPCQICCEKRTSKAILCIISQVDSLVFRRELGNNHKWAKDFFLENTHLGCDVCKDCWFDKVTLSVANLEWLTTKSQFGTFFLTNINEG
ncbi:hypothetical protein HG531_007050 [Fusarium graminearum]|nr:hypothetical protein HG531_007050 [Fusarium graminearum]